MRESTHSVQRARPDATTKNEAPAGGSARGSWDQRTADRADCAAAERDRVDAHDQRLTQIRARANTKRITMQVLATTDGGTELLFTWCGLSKFLPNADAASIWLDHIGAPR